jgi:hypothetical protein
LFINLEEITLTSFRRIQLCLPLGHDRDVFSTLRRSDILSLPKSRQVQRFWYTQPLCIYLVREEIGMMQPILSAQGLSSGVPATIGSFQYEFAFEFSHFFKFHDIFKLFLFRPKVLHCCFLLNHIDSCKEHKRHLRHKSADFKNTMHNKQGDCRKEPRRDPLCTKTKINQNS